MGLSATNIRLIFTVSRKNDVSSNLQKISMNQMALSRNKDDVYEEYNQKLNATKLEYTGDKGELSYSNLMGQNAIANGYMNTLQDNSGRIVLDSTIANQFPGLATEGKAGQFASVCPNAETFQAVMQPLTTATVPTQPTTTDKSAAAAIWQKALASFEATYGDANFTSKTAGKTLAQTLEAMGSFKKMANGQDGRGTHSIEKRCGDSPTDSYLDIAKQAGTAQTIVELYNDHCKLSNEEGAKRANLAYQLLAADIVGKIGSALGIANLAQTEEMQDTIKSLEFSYDTDIRRRAKSPEAGAEDICRRGIFAIANDTETNEGPCRNKFFCNLSELTRRLLAAVADYCDGMDGKETVTTAGTGFSHDASDSGSGITTLKTPKTTMIGAQSTNDKGLNEVIWTKRLEEYYSEVVGEGKIDPDEFEFEDAIAAAKSSTPASTGSTTTTPNSVLESMYNSLCNNGWVVDTYASDSDSLKEKLTNGTYTIGGLNAKNTDLFEEVADTETQDQAEKWYDNELNKIKRKEQAFDNQQTKLQTEYTALNTEYDSLKAILNDNIAKSFAYCQS